MFLILILILILLLIVLDINFEEACKYLYININNIDISYSTDLCLNIISDYNLYFDFSYSGKSSNFTRTIQVRDTDDPEITFNDFS